MRNDKNRSQSRKSDVGHGFLSNSVRAISSVASTLRSAGASIASSISAHEDDRRREQVQWAGFDKLELQSGISHRILLLAYTTGFQVWDIEDAANVHEVLSRRDGPVAFLQMQPQPSPLDIEDSGFKAALPLLLVVTGEAAFSEGNVPGALGPGYSNTGVASPQSENSNFIPTVVRFYSLKTHAYVHKMRFRSAIYSVRCSPQIVAVALRNQICCYNAATLENVFNVPTYPIPQGGQGPSVNIGYGPMDVGQRWLAYVATHALVSNSGRISPQTVSLSTSSLNGSTVAHYAKESSKQIAAGIVTLGDKGYKTLTKYCSELLPDSFSPPGSGSVNWKNNMDASSGHAYDPERAGTVIVKDLVSKEVIAQFRPHSSPISALCFDPSGTLLVTASIYGHNLNVFRIMPSASGNGSSSVVSNVNASHMHLYKLVRGVTNAVIQDISFSDDSHWIAITSSRGTSHLFPISPFGVGVGPHNHGCILVDSSIGFPLQQCFTAVCPGSSSLFLKGYQKPLPPHPITLSAVCKIKNGNDGWCSAISGAAAAASGKLNMSSGAVAAVFHNGGSQSLESQIGNSDIEDQLWVFSSSGHVIQYVLLPYAAADTLHNPEVAGGSSGTRETEDLRAIARQKWDVCRKSNWEEREDHLYKLGGIEGQKEGTGVCRAGYRNGSIYVQSGDSEQSVKADTLTEEKCRWYLSNAEVHTRQERPGIWTKPEVLFHIITVQTSVEKYGDYGEIEIENLPTCAIEIKSKDLMPLARNNLSGNLPGASALVVNQIKHGSAQSGTNGIGVGCAEMQCPNSRHSSHGSVSATTETEAHGSPRTSYLPIQISNFEMTNYPVVGSRQVDVPRWSQGTVSHMHEVENFPSMDRNSKILPVHGHGLGKGDSIRSAGDLGFNDEDCIDGLMANTGTNGNLALCSDDNSDSFGSSTWDVGAEGETDSPSSVLQTTSISKQCLHDFHMLQGNTKSKSQENAKSANTYNKEGSSTSGENGMDGLEHRTVEDSKSVDSYIKESSPTGEENDGDSFDGAMFPFCEEE